MKAIPYKNRAELFVLNGNMRPIGYEFHNGVKPNRYNENMVKVSFSIIKFIKGVYPLQILFKEFFNDFRKD